MRLVLVRHGDPNYEKDCLTELGLKQADIAAQRLLSEGIQKIYSSPHGRAQQTATAFSLASGIDQIETLDFTKEIRYGKEDALYESGNPWFAVDDMVREGWDLRNPDWRNHPAFKENTATVDADYIAQKTDEWLKTLGYERTGLYYKCTGGEFCDKTIAVFCHGGSTSAMLARIFNIEFPNVIASLHFPHTGITILRFDDTVGNVFIPIMELASDGEHIRKNK